MYGTHARRCDSLGVSGRSRRIRKDAVGGQMWGARWLVLPVALTALAVGGSSSGPRPRIEEPQSASPTEMRTRTAEESVPKAELAKLSAFLDKATPIFAGTVPDA